MAIVLIIAIVLLLVGNYIKNFHGGIALSYQPVELNFQKDNPADEDLIMVATSNTELKNFSQKTVSSGTFSKYVVLGIIATAKPTTDFGIKVDKIYLRGSQVNVNYHINSPDKGQIASDVISYPNTLIKLERASLPTNVPIEFRFNNLSNLRTELVSKIIK